MSGCKQCGGFVDGTRPKADPIGLGKAGINRKRVWVTKFTINICLTA